MNPKDNPFFRSETEPSGQTLHADALTTRLLEAAVPGNARRCGDCCSIRLWSEWAQMLHALPSLGEVLVVTGNDGAILGERREYPALEFAADFRRGQSLDGGLDVEFIPWGGGLAVCHHHGQGEAGTSHALEFRDHMGAVIHKVCLTPKTRRDRFVEWVEHHQAIGGPAPAAPDFSPARWRTVQQRHWLDYDEIEELPAHALEGIFRFASERGAPLRVIVGNEGVVQSGDLVPRGLHVRGPWLFTSDDAVGLHFEPGRLGEHILQRIPSERGRPPELKLKSFTEDGNLRLALAAPRDVSEDEWTDFLIAAIQHL